MATQTTLYGKKFAYLTLFVLCTVSSWPLCLQQLENDVHHLHVLHFSGCDCGVGIMIISTYQLLLYPSITFWFSCCDQLGLLQVGKFSTIYLPNCSPILFNFGSSSKLTSFLNGDGNGALRLETPPWIESPQRSKLWLLVTRVPQTTFQWDLFVHP